MNFKKTLLFLITGIVGLVILYNFIISPMLMQNYVSNGGGGGMGMWGHMGGMYNSNTNYSNSIDIKSLSIIVLVIISIVVAAFYIFRDNTNRCVKCGYEIKDPSWKICPVCGAKTRGNGGRKR